MKYQIDDCLINKINELENYLRKEYPQKKLSIYSFIDDLKSIAPNLSIIALLNHLAAMYQEGLRNQDIIKDVYKTKKIFKIACEYIKNSEKDSKIISLAKQIHDIILNHLEKALNLYKLEYDLSC